MGKGADGIKGKRQSSRVADKKIHSYMGSPLSICSSCDPA